MFLLLFSLIRLTNPLTTLSLQCHIRVLESVQENITILLVGLEYLLNISYVDDIEVFKVLLVKFLNITYLTFVIVVIVSTISECHGLQVCLDYWNSLVSELFDSNHNLDSPAGVAHMMGLQVEVPLKYF